VHQVRVLPTIIEFCSLKANKNDIELDKMEKVLMV